MCRLPADGERREIRWLRGAAPVPSGDPSPVPFFRFITPRVYILATVPGFAGTDGLSDKSVNPLHLFSGRYPGPPIRLPPPGPSLAILAPIGRERNFPHPHVPRRRRAEG